jgi:hypothetical protein
MTGRDKRKEGGIRRLDLWLWSVLVGCFFIGLGFYLFTGKPEVLPSKPQFKTSAKPAAGAHPWLRTTTPTLR